jgi:MFS family permease
VVYEITGSGTLLGAVMGARAIPMILLTPVSGVAADRYDRKRLMLGAHVVRALVLGALAGTIIADALTFWLIPAAAFVQGTVSTVFAAAQAGALKAVVPRAQLPTAVGAIEARVSTIEMVGPPIGGVLFAVARSLPFVAHTLSYVFAFIALALMRTPFQEARERDPTPLRVQVAEGFRFLWRQPFIRTSTFLFGIGNFSIPGMLLVLIVLAERRGISSGGVGLLLTLFGAGTLLGAVASPLFRRALPVRTIMLLEFWAGLLAAAYLVVPSIWVLLAALTIQGITLPVTNSVVDSYRLAIIPDRLLGRVETVSSQIALAIAPLGPLAAGVLLSSTSPRATVACFLVFSASLVVWGMLSPALKRAPDVHDLDFDAEPA